VAAVHLDQKGRGRALRQVWSGSAADVLAYTDVDLSTDLAALLPLVALPVSGHSDLAVGTRLHRGARIVRGPKREAISRAYNRLLGATLGTGFSDAQCGFKAIRADAARALLPLVRDAGAGSSAAASPRAGSPAAPSAAGNRAPSAACSTAAAPAPRWWPCSSTTPATTPGSPPPSGPTTRPATSWPPETR
jgi:hypothetical protein